MAAPEPQLRGASMLPSGFAMAVFTQLAEKSVVSLISGSSVASELADKAASELAVHVLHALNSIPEKMR